MKAEQVFTILKNERLLSSFLDDLLYRESGNF